ncbi:MAG: hypothetical protein ACXWUX_12280 [Allosphingosinicella sp.]
MKKLTIAALLGAQLLPAAQPAFAADLMAAEATRTGAFGGLRIHVPLDRARRERRPIRAGLAIAPTVQSRNLQGETRSRIGEGLELGIAGRSPVTLSLAGTRLDRLGAVQDEAEEEDGGGPGSVGWVAIGVAALAVVGAGIIYLSFEDINED